jgi:hypothetical protein
MVELSERDKLSSLLLQSVDHSKNVLIALDNDKIFHRTAEAFLQMQNYHNKQGK